MSLSLIRVRYEPTNCMFDTATIRTVATWMDAAMLEHARLSKRRKTKQFPTVAPPNPFAQMLDTDDPICLGTAEAENLICFLRWMHQNAPMPEEMGPDTEMTRARLTVFSNTLEEMRNDKKPIHIVFG